MARGRKIHIQQSLLDREGKKPRSSRGGKQRGAGRKPKGARAGTSHATRGTFSAHEPLHVSIRVRPEVGVLRREDIFAALRKATVTAARKDWIRIVQISVQNTHLHLIVESRNRKTLAIGMAGFSISAAKWIKRALYERTHIKHRGPVFADRYHVEVIGSPRQARNAPAYVLNNWRKHSVDDGEAQVDKFSTGVLFVGWAELGDRAFIKPKGYEPLVTRPARTWLLRTGWKRHGLISVFERPGPAARAARKPARRARQSK